MFADHLSTLRLGMGLSENIREAYAFLATNYSPEDSLSQPDSIFLLGFSRGAFTARSIGGFISAVGILTSKAMPFFYECFSDWENAGNNEYTPRFIDTYCHNNPDEKLEAKKNQPCSTLAHIAEERGIDKYMTSYRRHLLSLGLTQEVKIKAIGVWDTVGAQGVPINPIVQKLGLPAFIHEYRWYDTRLSDSVENAFQALALDENRSPYAPAVWELDHGGRTNLKQVWFPGAHSNVGGSYADYGIANISLAWMMDQLAGNSRDTSEEFSALDWIQFHPDAIDLCVKHTSRYFITQGRSSDEYKGWAMGKVYNSNTFPQSLMGSVVRTPGLYRETNYKTGKYIDEYLTKTNEYIHSSVRARIDLGGREVEAETMFQTVLRSLWRSITLQSKRDTYSPHRPRKGLAAAGPLSDWKLVDGHSSHKASNFDLDMTPGDLQQIYWEYVGKAEPVAKIMKEDVFAAQGFEEQLLLLHDQYQAEEIIYTNNKWQVCLHVRSSMRRKLTVWIVVQTAERKISRS